jgi:hypothetical protein
MNKEHPARIMGKYPRSDVIALSALALMVGLALLFPWGQLLPDKSANSLGNNMLFKLHDMNSRVKEDPATWRIEAKYRPESHSLQLYLSHIHNAPTKGFQLFAHFSADRSRHPAVVYRLRHQQNGNYRADNLRLGKGTWIMRVNGVRSSKTVFILEQPLVVP